MSNSGHFEKMLDLYPPEHMALSNDNIKTDHVQKSNKSFNSKLTYYKKKKKRRNKIESCCTDRAGKLKKNYHSISEAQYQAAHILSVRGEILDVYKCRNGKGWHLTNPKH